MSRTPHDHQDERRPVEPLLSVADARDVLGVSDPFIRRLVRDGRLPTVRIGRRRLVHPDDLREFIDKARREGSDG